MERRLIPDNMHLELAGGIHSSASAERKPGSAPATLPHCRHSYLEMAVWTARRRQVAALVSQLIRSREVGGTPTRKLCRQLTGNQDRAVARSGAAEASSKPEREGRRFSGLRAGTPAHPFETILGAGFSDFVIWWKSLLSMQAW